MRPSTADILSTLAANAAGSFSVARSLPPQMYHDAGIFELEKERIFRHEWICIGRLAEMPDAGDYLCGDIVDAPVFVVRQRDNSVKAFANVCAHRSARLLQASGHASRISCPYHSWTYNLDGRLIGAPFMKETPGFDVKSYRLTELACDAWQGFVYVNLYADAAPISQLLSDLTAQIGNFRMANYVPVFSREETWNTNWKCLVENFMDAYHIHRVHKGSFGQYGSSEEQTKLFDGGDSFSYHYVQEDDGPKSVHAHPDNTWLKGPDRNRTYLINVFPSHTIQLQPDFLWYLSILPLGTDKISIRWSVSIPEEILDAVEDRQAHIDEVMALLHQVNSEDKPIVESVFEATRSPSAARGPMSYLERNVWQFGRYLARRLCIRISAGEKVSGLLFANKPDTFSGAP